MLRKDLESPKFLLIAIYLSLFPSLIDLPVNLTKCQVRTGTAYPSGALKLPVSYLCILHTICQMPF
jgi:hypothetical protein